MAIVTLGRPIREMLEYNEDMEWIDKEPPRYYDLISRCGCLPKLLAAFHLWRHSYSPYLPPEPLYTNVFANIHRQLDNNPDWYTSVSSVLISDPLWFLFDWANTPEGFECWDKANQAAKEYYETNIRNA